MAVVLYKKTDGVVTSERCNPLQLDSLLSNGYFLTKECDSQEKEECEFSELSDDEVKELAVSLDVEVGRKQRASLIKLIKDKNQADD